MNCEECQSLLGAYADGELDAAGDQRIETHLAGCPDCARAFAQQRTLAAVIHARLPHHRAPEDLRESILGSLLVEAAAGQPAGPLPRTAARCRRGLAAVIAGLGDAWVGAWRQFSVGGLTFAVVVVFLLGVLAGSLGWRGRVDSDRTKFLASEIVSGHVRSLLGTSHLADVISSDRHTVKPWFEGKLDFSPPVTDLAAQGFPLVGGRLDYLHGRAVASLIYRRDKHIINVFIWPASPDDTDGVGPPASTRQGYHLLSWSQAGMNWWAVSDLNEAELKQLMALLQTSTSK